MIIRKASWQKGVLVALDPGSNKAGLAMFLDKRLIWAGPVINPKKTKGAQGWREMAEIALKAVGTVAQVDTFVTEVMDSYVDPRQQKGPQNDLLEVQGMAAWFGGVLDAAEVVSAKPSEWKGQMSKDVCHARALKALDAEEKESLVLKPAVAKLDILDAVSLGLWALRRVP